MSPSRTGEVDEVVARSRRGGHRLDISIGEHNVGWSWSSWDGLELVLVARGRDVDAVVCWTGFWLRQSHGPRKAGIICRRPLKDHRRALSECSRHLRKVVSFKVG